MSTVAVNNQCVKYCSVFHDSFNLKNTFNTGDSTHYTPKVRIMFRNHVGKININHSIIKMQAVYKKCARRPAKYIQKNIALSI